VLAQRLGLAAGDRVEVGDAVLDVRAVLLHQPDRSLRADWGAAPVLVADGALAATGLVQPLSRVQYRYRLRLDDGGSARRPARLRCRLRRFGRRHPQRRRPQRPHQRGAGPDRLGLLLVGFSALFIGGLGVFNSVQAYLQGKLGTLATLRALGLRDARLAGLVLLQMLMLALGASTVGALAGPAWRWPAGAGRRAPAARRRLGRGPGPLLPAAAAISFGVLTALTFALPALGRALTVSPAALFRGWTAGAAHAARCLVFDRRACCWHCCAAAGAAARCALRPPSSPSRFAAAVAGGRAARLARRRRLGAGAAAAGPGL
jgi:putative ABC transport system permease protein